MTIRNIYSVLKETIRKKEEKDKDVSTTIWDAD